jgi:hypothetical protein
MVWLFVALGFSIDRFLSSFATRARESTGGLVYPQRLKYLLEWDSLTLTE